MGTIREILAESVEGAPQFGPKRPRLYSDLTSEEKDIWDNVKMFLEVSELTKEDRESQLYDEFEHFRQHKGESIHDYYVRFAKLINDMRNIKMTMSRLQLNSKFVNNMLPEWVDPLALLSNVSNPQHYSPSSSASSSTQVPQPLVDSSSPTEDLIENLTNTLVLLTQSYITFLPQTNNQLRTSSNARNQATVQDGSVVVQNVQGRPHRARLGQARPVKCYNCNGTWHIARNYTQPKRPQNSKYYKDKMLLMQAQENGVALDAEQLLFLAGGQDNVYDDDAPTAQTMFMANLSSADPVTDEAGPSYDSDILSEVQDHDQYQDAACAHHEGHVMHDNEVPVVHSDVSSIPNDAFVMIYDDMFLMTNLSLTHHGTHRKHNAIERKNLLIANDNLIAECLSKEVFSVATNSELNVAQFTEMTVAHTADEVRCLALEVELVNLRDKHKHDNQKELINHFSKLETADSQITKLTEQVTDLLAQNSLFRAENDKIKQHYKELYDSIKITRAKHLDQVTKLTTKNVNLKTSVSKDKVNRQVSARDKHAIDVEPIVSHLRNNRDAHLDYLRHLKESVETIRDIIEDAK
nr:hypothetical protein [Tanacetum cinerariifolium]